MIFVQVSMTCFLFAFYVHAGTWSDTNPPLNLTHIFDGEINSKGRAVGFHARPFGKDPKDAHLQRVISGPNRLGVYTGQAEVYDLEEERWKTKSFSSFFPDQMSRDQVIALIISSFQKAKVDKRGKWRGPSSVGFTIEGWLCPKGGTATCPDGAINTAYPIYRKDK